MSNKRSLLFGANTNVGKKVRPVSPQVSPMKPTLFSA